jgi:phosphoglycerate dehydrogenase-like enzyme
MPKVLVSDPVDQVGIDIISQVAQVDVKTGLPEEELVKIISEYDALMVRSGTKVTQSIIEAGSQLKIIGRAGVGVDNIDVAAATRRGIVVVNSRKVILLQQLNMPSPYFSPFPVTSQRQTNLLRVANGNGENLSG